MAGFRTLVLALVVASAAQAASHQEVANVAANPVRKVVTMLQSMQKKVEAEGAKDQELYEKFMCYCKSSGGDLTKSIAEAETKMPEVGADIKEAEEQVAQLKEELKQHQADREAAKAAMAEATAIREKEAAAYAAADAESKANIEAVTSAAAAIEKGMVGGFLQTDTAKALRRFVTARRDMSEGDRDSVLSFLSAGDGATDAYAPASGEVVGILKQMADEMSKDAADATATEDAAIKTFEELMAAKKKEVAASTAAIEKKTVRQGQLAVEVVQMKNDLSDTEKALMDDKAFLADLEDNCASKTKEFEENKKIRADELVALAETIKVLNDDDALELFKKTLPSASSSLVQVRASSATIRANALRVLTAATDKFDRPQLDFITMALRGKKVGFDKVISLIDKMVATLKQEQVDDDSKQEQCNVQLDSADDKKKGLERSAADLERSMADAEQGIASLTEDMKALEEGIKQLDKDVAEATIQRKDDHEEYLELMSSNSAAKELLAFAKNRLNKFYNPKLYRPPPKRVLSEEERITVNMGGTLEPTEAPGGIAGTGVTAFMQVSAIRGAQGVAPPPPPETFGAYSKKGEEGTGVIAMIDLLIKDLDKEMTESETAEKLSQGDYEKLMKDSAAKRAADTKELTDKASAKANMGADLEAAKEEKAATDKELAATVGYISSLHGECDWLLKYFDVRKEARAGEIDSLLKAKAILSGADYSLVQARVHRFLGRI